MDTIDRIICDVVQRDGRASNAAVAEAAGLPLSTANDRLRRLTSAGTIKAWHAVLDADRVGAGLACFVLIDMRYDGEAEAVETLCARDEVQELHHISGAHSYLAKLRVRDMSAVQEFLDGVVKPLKAIEHTETVFSLKTHKESSVVAISHDSDDARP